MTTIDMDLTSSRWSSWCAVLLSVAFAGCNRPKPGGACQLGQAICEDTSRVMACQGGVFVEARCRGAGGCTKVGSKISCDDSVGEAGDVCLELESENRACSGDKKTSLLCDKGKFKAVETCRGPKGCQINGDSVTCDAKVAEKGDVCRSPGSFACAVGSKSRVVCKDGKFVFDRNCRGATGCHELDQACDETTSDVGDPCGVSGMAACNPDGSQELTCQGGQFVKDRSCRKTPCHVLPTGRIECL